MTSISSSAMQRFTSPREVLQNELLSEISAGTISADDQDALSTALDTIDAAMKGDASSRSRGAGRPSPDEMTSKINGLIDDQVESGALTSDQADELKTLFANAMPARGPGGPGGAGGPPPGGPPPGGAEGATESSSTGSDVEDLLQSFLELLKEQQSAGATYGSDGDSSQSFTLSLLIDYKA